MRKRKNWTKRLLTGIFAASLACIMAVDASATGDVEIVVSDSDFLSTEEEQDESEMQVGNIEIVESVPGSTTVLDNNSADIEISIDSVVNLDVGSVEVETESESETEFDEDLSQDEIREKLTEILDQSIADREDHSAIAQYLDFDRLGEAIGKNGLTFDFRAGLGNEAANALGIPDTIRDTSYLHFQTQTDPVNRQWKADTGFVLMDMDMISFSLYGDRKMLALSSPQLYEKALGIYSGNLYEQMKDSWAADVAESIPEEYRDFELSFFPDEKELEEWQEQIREISGYSEEFEERYEKLQEDFLDSVVYSRRKDGDEVVYLATAEREAIRNLYFGIFDLYTEPLNLSDEVYNQMEQDLEEEFDTFLEAVPEDPTLAFHVKDQVLNKITCEIFVDGSKLEPEETWAGLEEGSDEATEAGSEEGTEEAETGFEEGSDEATEAGSEEGSGEAAETGSEEGTEEAETGFEEGSEEETEPGFEENSDIQAGGIEVSTPSGTKRIEKGYFSFEIAFWEETEKMASTDVSLCIEDEDRNVLDKVLFTSMRSENGAKTEKNLDVTFMEAGLDGSLETTYYCNLYSGLFNSETGEYDITLSLTDQDTEDVMYLQVESNFADVVPGESFTWNIRQVTVGYNDDSIGLLDGQIRIQAKPTDLAQPEDPKMIFEMTETELTTVMEKISENLNILLGNEPETELETEAGQEEEIRTEMGSETESETEAGQEEEVRTEMGSETESETEAGQEEVRTEMDSETK